MRVQIQRSAKFYLSLSPFAMLIYIKQKKTNSVNGRVRDERHGGHDENYPNSFR